MLRKRSVCLSALYIAACAPAFAADPVPQSTAAAACPPPQSAPAACPPAASRHVSHRRGISLHRRYVWRSEHHWSGAHVSHVPSVAGGGLAWGLAPGMGQLGAAGFGYYHVDNCWSYQMVYDRYGNYVGEQPANICLQATPH